MQQVFNGIQHLSEALTGSSKVFLVCDNSFYFLCIKDDIEAMGVPFVVFSDFTPNPLYEDVCKGVNLFKSSKCDTILSVGGGSSMDVAKCIKLYCKMPEDCFFIEQPYKDTGVKLIAIPTTAGTGSESTRYAVIYHNGKKQSITHDSIIPNIAIIEPKVLKTLPIYQKKCTMLDAFCQGIESWWSVNSTEESKMYSKLAVETITKWWREYIFENTDESANHIMKAANYAGRAICITQTTAPHAFSYKITSLYNIPHGHAVAICLPEIWFYMIKNMDKCIDIRGKEYLINVFEDISFSMGKPSVESAIIYFKSIMDELNMQNPISNDICNDVEILAESVNPIRLKNNPIGLDFSNIKVIYKNILI